MKTRSLLLLAFLIIGMTSSNFAQEADSIKKKDPQKEIKLRPIRFGIKLGFPNLVGGNVEYLTPLLDNKVSVNGDFSRIKSEWFGLEDAESGESTDSFNYSFLDLGANYYFFKPGKGLYSGLSYSLIKFDGQLSTTSDDPEGLEKEGIEYYKVNNNSINIKVGARLGGLFYFRPELGYSFNPLPESVNSETIYEDGSRESTTYNLNEEEAFKPLTSGFTFNIGMGFAF